MQPQYYHRKHHLKYALSLILIFILNQPAPIQAMSIHELAQLSQQFITTVNLNTSQLNTKQLSAVIYGHPEIGFFKASTWTIQSRHQLQLKIVAPSYQLPVQFYGKLTNGNYIFIHQRTLNSPTPSIFLTNRIKVISGKLTHPFYLLNGALPRKALIQPQFNSKDPELFRRNHHRFTYVMVINRFGEIVWIHVPVIDDTLFSSYLSSKAVGRGFYGLMFGKHSGYFEIVKYSGEVMRKFSSKDAEVPFVMHHDYETLGAQKLFAVGNEKQSLYKFTRNPAHKDQTFVSDTIIGIDLIKGQSKKLLSFTSRFNPNITPYMTGDAKDDKKFVMWGQPKADFDFLHINSVDYVSEWNGVLVSFRNISKVGLLDTQFQKVLWTLGSEPSDTYYIAEKTAQFRHQHTPFITSKDTLMLFDNAITTKRSRIVEYKLSSRGAQLIWEFQPKIPLFAKDRSSVYPLAKDRFAVYFVKPIIGNQTRAAIPHQDLYLEIDRAKNELGVMAITFPVASPGYRMIPITSVSDDPPHHLNLQRIRGHSPLTARYSKSSPPTATLSQP